MNANIIITIVTTVGSLITGMFFTIRYAIKETNKSKTEFLTFLRNNQQQQLEYYENKNGIVERMGNTFTKAINKNSRAVEKLSDRIKNNHGK